ncbi:MAG: site-specific integrase [Ilumatobacteraceae bacterium]
MSELRKAPGMRERSPGVWELIVAAGVDPVTGRRRQVSRTFRGNLREAKQARAELLVEVSKGRHAGSAATVEQLFGEWIVELRRKGRSPNTVYGYERVYERNIRQALGGVPVTKVTTKMLTNLYGAHQKRGLAPRSVYQIHACLSSMFTQACRWGWRDTNPAQWAEPPSLPNVAPVVPAPEEVSRLIAAAQKSRRPEYARAILVAATTGVRRSELCALRRSGIDWEKRLLTVSASMVMLKGVPLQEIPTKNRRERVLALDDFTLAALRAQVELLEQRAALARTTLDADAYVFTDDVRGLVPWKPDALSQYFGRLRDRAGLSHLDFHDLRRFMETYGQEMGYSVSQVAMRAGHDPSVAARHYSGRVLETDRQLATAVAALLHADA